MAGTECNNKNKELYSRPAILEVILNQYGQNPISFLELLGDGTGAEFYSTWLNINKLILIEYDYKKYKRYPLDRIYIDFDLIYTDLNKYFLEFASNKYRKPFDVINLDFCTFLYDNGKDNCTASIINNMFKYEAIKDGGLVFFTFMVKGLGANMNKAAIKERDDIFEFIQNLALENGYDCSEELVYFYKSSKPTQMLNLGVKVWKI